MRYAIVLSFEYFMTDKNVCFKAFMWSPVLMCLMMIKISKNIGVDMYKVVGCHLDISTFIWHDP